jgi:hypothetical protein
MLALLIFIQPVISLQAQAIEQVYKNGLALERTKRYSEAVKAFEEAIAINPRYAWAYRDLGTCYYYLGDMESARHAYAQYLALNPRDTQTKAFVAYLERKQPLNSDAHVPSTGIFVGLGLGGLNNSNSDIKNFLANGSSADVSCAPNSLNWLGELRAGYQTHSGWNIYGKLGLGPWRDSNISWSSAPADQSSLDLFEWSLGLGGGYRWLFGRHSLGVNADFGPSFLSGSYSINGNEAGGFNINSWAMAYELFGNYEIRVSPHLGLGVDLGYRLARFDSLSVTSTWGYAKTQNYTEPLKMGDGSQAYFDNSGPFLRLLLCWHSTP